MKSRRLLKASELETLSGLEAFGRLYKHRNDALIEFGQIEPFRSERPCRMRVFYLKDSYRKDWLVGAILGDRGTLKCFRLKPEFKLEGGPLRLGNFEPEHDELVSLFTSPRWREQSRFRAEKSELVFAPR